MLYKLDRYKGIASYLVNGTQSLENIRLAQENHFWSISWCKDNQQIY